MRQLDWVTIAWSIWLALLLLDLALLLSHSLAKLRDFLKEFLIIRHV